jgi:hypothetical protein
MHVSAIKRQCGDASTPQSATGPSIRSGAGCDSRLPELWSSVRTLPRPRRSTGFPTDIRTARSASGLSRRHGSHHRDRRDENLRPQLVRPSPTALYGSLPALNLSKGISWEEPEATRDLTESARATARPWPSRIPRTLVVRQQVDKEEPFDFRALARFDSRPGPKLLVETHPIVILVLKELLANRKRSGWPRTGRPAGRGGVSREQRFSPSTRWGCSRTGPERDRRFRFDREPRTGFQRLRQLGAPQRHTKSIAAPPER